MGICSGCRSLGEIGESRLPKGMLFGAAKVKRKVSRPRLKCADEIVKDISELGVNCLRSTAIGRDCGVAANCGAAHGL